jgi:beta-glucanase (GH16 family)
MTTDVKGGGVVSFFWIEQPNYGSHEWDVEFTLSDSWAGTTNPGRVSFTTHPLDNTQWVNLGFNPSQAFHDYGFLWTPGRIDFTVDGQVVRTVTDPNLKTDATGYIMMNTWSGVSNFGGGPPSQAATSVYDWVKFYAGATSIPADSTAAGLGSSTTTISEGNSDEGRPSRSPQRRHGSIRRTAIRRDRHCRRHATSSSNTLHFEPAEADVRSRQPQATPRWRRHTHTNDDARRRVGLDNDNVSTAGRRWQPSRSPAAVARQHLT